MVLHRPMETTAETGQVKLAVQRGLAEVRKNSITSRKKGRGNRLKIRVYSGLMNRDIATFAWLIALQKERAEKHKCRAHRKQPVRIHIRENRGLRLKQALPAGQR